MAIECSNALPNGQYLVDPVQPQELDSSKLRITLTTQPKQMSENIQFGQQTTDHMLVASYDPITGWSAPEIKPYERLSLDPTSSCLHYATSVFEGMKAYRGPDGKARLFRPYKNMERLLTSADRVALPLFNPQALLDCLIKLVAIDERWIPSIPDHSLYIRPFIIGTREALGVVPSDSAMIIVVMSPAGPLLSSKGGITPSIPATIKPTNTAPNTPGISLLAVSQFARAWPGGTGCYKVSGNYAPGFYPQKSAKQLGYDQVLYLLEDTNMNPGTREWKVTEAGAMNFFAVVRREDGDIDLITPPLDGTILPGITRSSILELADAHSQIPLSGVSPSLKIRTHEKTITLNELSSWHRAGRLQEVFVVGTAVVVATVKKIGVQRVDAEKDHGGVAPLKDEVKSSQQETVLVMPTYADKEGFGPIGRGLKERLVDVQEGRVEWSGWSVVCN